MPDRFCRWADLVAEAKGRGINEDELRAWSAAGLLGGGYVGTGKRRWYRVGTVGVILDGGTVKPVGSPAPLAIDSPRRKVSKR